MRHTFLDHPTRLAHSIRVVPRVERASGNSIVSGNTMRGHTCSSRMTGALLPLPSTIISGPQFVDQNMKSTSRFMIKKKLLYFYSLEWHSVSTYQFVYIAVQNDPNLVVVFFFVLTKSVSWEVVFPDGLSTRTPRIRTAQYASGKHRAQLQTDTRWRSCYFSSHKSWFCMEILMLIIWKLRFLATYSEKTHKIKCPVTQLCFLATYSEKTHKIKCPVTQVPTLPITVQNFLEVLLGQSPHTKDRHHYQHIFMRVNSRQPGRIWTIACQADSWLGALHVCAHRDLNTILMNIYITYTTIFYLRCQCFQAISVHNGHRLNTSSS